MKFRWLLILALAASTCSYASPRRDAPWVVSHFVCLDHTDDTVSDGYEPSFRSESKRWEWRVYEPATGRNLLFLKLSAAPLYVRWDSIYTSVEFMEGKRLVRAAWALPGRARSLAEFPMDSSICGFWRFREGRYRVATMRDNLDPFGPNSAILWEHQPEGWAVLRADTGRWEGCEDVRYLYGAPPSTATMVSSLLDSMRIGNYQDSVLRRLDSGSPDGFDAEVWIAFSRERSIGLEMRGGFGDTYHGFAPVTWVDRAHGRRSIIYPVGRTYPDHEDQVAFAVRGHYLLVVEEYSGEHPVVADMRSGKILKDIRGPSASAVWVPAPSGWSR